MNILVGYTGFVGQNLHARHNFDGLYNSKNVSDAYGTAPDLCVYSGVRSEKFRADNFPEEDLAHIHGALANIKRIAPKRLVLISTVDVIPAMQRGDIYEDTPYNTAALTPYGRNRLYLENEVRKLYPQALIIRLPALFGRGLKKNFVYDMMHYIPAMLKLDKFVELTLKESQVAHYYTPDANGFYRLQPNLPPDEKIKLKAIFKRLGFSALNFTDSRSRFSFYNLNHLWTHIQMLLANQVTLAHMANEPISAAELYQNIYNEPFNNAISANPFDYSFFKTRHAALLGSGVPNGYICDKTRVAHDIKKLVTTTEVNVRVDASQAPPTPPLQPPPQQRMPRAAVDANPATQVPPVLQSLQSLPPLQPLQPPPLQPPPPQLPPPVQPPIQPQPSASEFSAFKIVIAFIIALHPAAFLLAILEDFRRVNMGNIPGTVALGALLGCLLLVLCKRLDLKFENASFAEFAFLLGPFAFYALVLVNETFNLGLFWLLFIFFYLLMGAIIYIRSHEDAENKTELYVTATSVVFLVVSLMIIFINRGVVYTVDSFSYYDMSHSIFTNFGVTGAVRQYVIHSELAVSFPYLFPVMISVVNMLTGFSIYSGNVINLVAVFVSIYLFIRISAKLTGFTYPGIIGAALMVFNPEYMDEVLSARAVPLSVLCVLLILNVMAHSKIFEINTADADEDAFIDPQESKFKAFLRKTAAPRDLFLIGMFAGAGMVMRFDFMAIALLMGIAFFFVFLAKRRLLLTVPFYVLGLLVFTWPWIVYSLMHFDTIWVFDNSSTIFLIHPSAPIRPNMPGEIIPTFFTDRAAWITSRQDIIVVRITNLMQMLTRPVEMIVLVGAAAIGIASSVIRNENNNDLRGMRVLLIFTTVIYVAKTVVIYLMGYGDFRLHAETNIIMLFVILCYLAKAKPKPMAWIGLVIVIGLVSITSVVQPTVQHMHDRMRSPIVDMPRITVPEHTIQLAELLTEHANEHNRDIRLFNLGGLSVNEFGAHTGILTFQLPGMGIGLNEERFLFHVENFIRPNYVFMYDATNHWASILRRNHVIIRVGDSDIFALTPIEELHNAGTVRATSLTDYHWYNGINRVDQVILLEQTEYNVARLENAQVLTTGGANAVVVSVFHLGQNWIHVTIQTDAPMDAFAYPQAITVLRMD